MFWIFKIVSFGLSYFTSRGSWDIWRDCNFNVLYVFCKQNAVTDILSISSE